MDSVQKGQDSERRRVFIDYVCYHTNGTAWVTDIIKEDGLPVVKIFRRS